MRVLPPQPLEVFGVEEEVIRDALVSFKGVAREAWSLVRELKGIKIYNDTTATTPEATVAGLKALDPENKRTIILIMGGADKALNMSELLEVAPPALQKKFLLLAGTGTDRIKKELPDALVYKNLSEAVSQAYWLSESRRHNSL
jgi:UDP-N-acetylmuramoylalanine-D-glutamate ligase